MKSKHTREILTGIAVVIIALICVMPFLLIVMSSITDEQTLIVNGYSFFPEKYSLYAYRYILSGGGVQVLHGYLISIVVTTLGTLISLILTVLLAYPLSREDLPFRNVFAFLLFFTMLFNGGPHQEHAGGTAGSEPSDERILRHHDADILLIRHSALDH